MISIMEHAQQYVSTNTKNVEIDLPDIEDKLCQSHLVSKGVILRRSTDSKESKRKPENQL